MRLYGPSCPILPPLSPRWQRLENAKPGEEEGGSGEETGPAAAGFPGCPCFPGLAYDDILAIVPKLRASMSQHEPFAPAGRSVMTDDC